MNGNTISSDAEVSGFTPYFQVVATIGGRTFAMTRELPQRAAAEDALAIVRGAGYNARVAENAWFFDGADNSDRGEFLAHLHSNESVFSQSMILATFGGNFQ